MLRFRFFVALITLLGTCGYALIKGGREERITGLCFVLASVASALILPSVDIRFRQVEVGFFLVDLALLAVLIAIALFSSKFWPILMAAMQAVLILVHLGRLLALKVVSFAYYEAVSLWTYPMLLILLVATLVAHGEQRSRTLPFWRR